MESSSLLLACMELVRQRLPAQLLIASESLENLQIVTTRPPRPEEESLNQNGTVP